MEKKYQIFVSSTFEDLKDERKKVQDTILSMYQFPIGMEMFSAADEEQWEIIQETIDSSDYYVLIIGHRYGSVIEEGEYAGISYTQKEFRYALEKGIPVLAFLIADSVLITKDKIEQETEKVKKLEAFKKEIMTGRHVEWWTSAEDLSNKVMNSLNKQINKGKRPGWIRADKFNVEEIQSENIELNRIIRKLEAEKAELQKQIVHREPKFVFKINDGTPLKFTYSDIYTEDIRKIREYYMPLTKEDVGEYDISENEIEEYNKSLPTEMELDKYLKEYRCYQNIKTNAIPFTVSYKNSGNHKAKDVHIKVSFSEGLLILKRKAVEGWGEPKKPQIPEHPVDKYIKNKIGMDKIEKLCKAINSSVIQPNYSFNVSDYEMNAGFYYSEDIEDNNLVIWEKSLIHTGEGCSREYFLIPARKGKFKVTISAICEEYNEQVVEEFEIELV